MAPRSSSLARQTTRTRLPEPTEYEEQVKIFEWAALAQAEFPDLELLIGSLNGVRLSIGAAVKAAKAGLKRGYPDLTLLVPKGQFYGLLIELKRQKSGFVSAEQRDWIMRLNLNGYRAVVCRGADSAINEIKSYLRGDYR